MNKEQGLLALGLGASIAAAYCTYKITKASNKAKGKRRKNRKFLKTKDVDGCSDNELDDVPITIIEGDDFSNSNFNEEKFSETSVPLNKVISLFLLYSFVSNFLHISDVVLIKLFLGQGKVI